MKATLTFTVTFALFMASLVISNAHAQNNSYDNDDGYDSNILGDAQPEIDQPQNSNSIGATANSAFNAARDILRGLQPRKQTNGWGQFEKLPKEQLNQYYNSSDEVQIHRELARPVETRKPFDNTIEDMNHSLKAEKKKLEDPAVDNDDTAFMGK